MKSLITISLLLALIQTQILAWDNEPAFRNELQIARQAESNMRNHVAEADVKGTSIEDTLINTEKAEKINQKLTEIPEKIKKQSTNVVPKKTTNSKNNFLVCPIIILILAMVCGIILWFKNRVSKDKNDSGHWPT